jgi:hypothetical protein
MTTPSPTRTKKPRPSTGQLRSLLRHPALRIALASLAAGLLSAGAASPATAAETCPNATLREQNNSTELPECRAYEMVSSPYKQGFGVIPQTFSDDGLVSYASVGSFVGNNIGGLKNQYMGVRTPAGWETQSLSPSSVSYFVNFEEPPVFSSDMRSSVDAMTPLSDPAEEGQGFYIRDFDGTFTRVGTGPTPLPEGVPIIRVLNASDDLSHLTYGGQVAWDGTEYVGISEAAELRHVNIDNNGATVPNASCPDAISGDGRVLVFSSGCNETGIRHVWARVGETTVAVSGSECTRGPSDPGGVCDGLAAANYAGAAHDGSRVFFTTAQQLVNSDTDQSNDLYECDIPSGAPAPIGTANPCSSLTEVSGVASGADVESVVAVSRDGSRIYFVAEGAVLAGNPGANDETAVAGNHNLYVWTKDAAHPAGTMTFVARLESNDLGSAQTTTDGRYLAFTTATPLVDRGPGADTDGRADMYRYDAASQTMQRISTSVTGSGGNDPGFDVLSNSETAIRGSVPYGISADGSMVVFATAEALSPQDTDGVTDVYLWHDGRVSLISKGGGGEQKPPWIDASGQNIYFVTDQPLTAADRDVNTDIYDARIGGGFDLSSPASCSGEACQGPSSAPPTPAGVPASETVQGATNLPEAPAPTKPTSKPLTRQQKLAKALKQCRKRPKHKRLACERQARKRYAPVKASARRSHR